MYHVSGCVGYIIGTMMFILVFGGLLVSIIDGYWVTATFFGILILGGFISDKLKP